MKIRLQATKELCKIKFVRLTGFALAANCYDALPHGWYYRNLQSERDGRTGQRHATDLRWLQIE
jgi:hypothetical protein